MPWTLILAPLLLTAGCIGLADDEAPGAVDGTLDHLAKIPVEGGASSRAQ